MNDLELQSLAMLVLAEVSAMNAENAQRLRDGLAIAYVDANYSSLDCVRCLDVELRKRNVLVTS